MRLIDADELTELLNWTFAKPPFSRKTVQKIIDMARTIDAVPVVRCKDCKWWKAEKQECYEWYDSPYAPADGYCFRAERKEE